MNDERIEKVAIGSKLKLIFPDGTEKIFKIGTSREADPQNGIISYECPLGRSLLGAKAGDSISYCVGKNTFTVQVVEIISESK